jgi:hypothetical protein
VIDSLWKTKNSLMVKLSQTQSKNNLVMSLKLLVLILFFMVTSYYLNQLILISRILDFMKILVTSSLSLIR